MFATKLSKYNLQVYLKLSDGPIYLFA